MQARKSCVQHIWIIIAHHTLLFQTGYQDCLIYLYPTVLWGANLKSYIFQEQSSSLNELKTRHSYYTTKDAAINDSDIIRHLQECITLNVRIQITLKGDTGLRVNTVDSASEDLEFDHSSHLWVDVLVHRSKPEMWKISGPPVVVQDPR
jgi:hypothetical protein